MEICTTGLWVDTQAGEVVDSPPVEGHLLAAPGSVLTAAKRDQIKRAAAVHGVAFEVATAPQPDEPSTDVEVATEPEPAKRAAKKGTTR